MIQEIRLKNFRSHAETVISDLRRFNMLAGANRSGKSGIRDAVLVALTGQTEVDDTGRNLDDLRTWNKKRKWGVELVMDGGEVFTRTEGEGPRAQVQGIIAQRFGVSPGVIRLCLLPRAILETDVKKRQALIQEVCPPAALVIPEDIAVLLFKHAMMAGTPPAEGGGLTATVRQIEGYYRTAYERRTEAKRLADAMGKAVIPEPPEDMAELKEWAPDRIEAAVKSISEKMGQLQAERDEMLNGKAQWNAKLGQLEEKVAERKDALDKHPSAESIKLETAAITARDFTKCPTCGYGSLSPEEQDAQLDVALDKVKEVERLRLNAYRRWQESDNELNAHKKAQPPEADPEAVATIERRLVNGQRKRDAFQQRLTALKVAAEIEERAADAKIAVGELETLCAALGPKGLPSTSSDDEDLSAFLGEVGSTMRSLGFDSVDLAPLVACLEPTVRATPVRLLSASERICFGIAFQTAIALRTGFKVVAVDEWESLDTDWAKIAQKILTASGCQVFVFNVLKDVDKYKAKARAANAGTDYRLYLVEQTDGASSVTLP